MQLLKSKLFVLAWGLWTTLFILPIPFLILGGQTGCWARSCSQFYCKGFLFFCQHILNLTFEVRGDLNAIKGKSVIFAAKHQSAWETMALYLLVPEIVPVLKVSLTRIPVFGWYLRHLKMIAVDRARGRQALSHMYEQAEAVVAENRNLLIFPEGTRQPPLKNPELKGGIFLLYKRLGLPVIPVALNSGVFWPKGASTISAGKVILNFLDPIYPGLEKRAFLDELHTVISSESDKLVKELSPDAMPALAK